jgi:molecular chaperone GrpE
VTDTPNQPEGEPFETPRPQRGGPGGPPQDDASAPQDRQDELTGEGAEPSPAGGPAPSEEAGAGNASGGSGSFGDAAAEMANESEVEGSEADTAEHDELILAQMALAERTADLQRLQAEFLNYKRRVERDRELIVQNATYKVLTPIIDVLDTIDRAREHGELDGGLKAVADQLERVVTGLGLTRFGAPGDAFDPNLHEALSHVGVDPEVKVTTAKHVAKSGYRIGDRVVRAAQVLVVDPVEPADGE